MVFLIAAILLFTAPAGGNEVELPRSERNLLALASKETGVLFMRYFEAPRERVFDAFTDPDIAIRWMGTEQMTMIECVIDGRVGGALRYVWRFEDGATVAMSGEFTEFAAPEHFSHTERFDDEWTGGEAHLRTTFAESNGKTRVTTVIHYPTREIRDSVFNYALIDAVAENYENLDRLLEN